MRYQRSINTKKGVTMASTTVVKVRVQELSKFGFKNSDRYVNYSKQLKDSDKMKVVPGAEFEAEFYVSDSGKEYLNKILSEVVQPKKNEPKATVKAEAKETKKAEPAGLGSLSATMSKADWSNKDRSQLIGGLSHDAATLSVAIMNVQGTTDVSEAVSLFEEVLKGLIKVRDGVK